MARADLWVDRGINLSVSYPLAVLGTMDRLLLYLFGITPSDERDLAEAMAWPAATFKYIFLAAEIVVLVLVVRSLIRRKIGIGESALIFGIPVLSFVLCASFGVFVVDRFLFPEQHKKEFGLTLPHSHTIGETRKMVLGILCAGSSPGELMVPVSTEHQRGVITFFAASHPTSQTTSRTHQRGAVRPL